MNNFLCYACVLVHLRGYERLKTSSFAPEFLEIMESEIFSSESFQNHRKQNRKDFRGEAKKRASKTLNISLMDWNVRCSSPTFEQRTFNQQGRCPFWGNFCFASLAIWNWSFSFVEALTQAFYLCLSQTHNKMKTNSIDSGGKRIMGFEL